MPYIRINQINGIYLYTIEKFNRENEMLRCLFLAM